MKAEDLNHFVTVAQEELKILREALRDKGWRYFQRPIGLGGIIVFCSYFYVYKYPIEALATVEQELEAARATAKYADTYQDLCAKLDRLYARLPKGKDPEQWLLGEIRDSLRLEGIVPISFSPPSESTVEGFKFISISVRCETSYQQLANWIARLERGASLMYIKTLTLGKRPRPIGSNTADVTVTTVVPEGQARSACGTAGP